MSAFNGHSVGRIQYILYNEPWGLGGDWLLNEDQTYYRFHGRSIAYGSDGTDWIAANNLITYARWGDDHILMSSGNDVVSGGAGADTFHFGPRRTVESYDDPMQTIGGTGGVDVIIDFDFRQNDKLVFDGVHVVSVEKSFDGPTEAGGISLGNDPKIADLKLTLSDTEGNTQTLWVLDTWTKAWDPLWRAQLHDLGYDGLIA